jgi:branched-subunit amino acid transport protein
MPEDCMALSYKTRRRLSLLVLVVGLPVYIGWPGIIVSLFERPSVFVELLVYVVLGIIWAIPLKSVFIGVGQADPDADPEPRRPRRHR